MELDYNRKYEAVSANLLGIVLRNRLILYETDFHVQRNGPYGMIRGWIPKQRGINGAEERVAENPIGRMKGKKWV